MHDGNPYQTLYKLSRALYQDIHDRDKLLHTILKQTACLIEAPYGCLFAFGQDQDIQAVHTFDAIDFDTEGWRILVEQGMVGFVYYGQRLLIIRDVGTDPRWMPLSVLPTEGAAIGIPLFYGSRVVAVMILMHDTPDYFDHHHISLLEEISGLARDAICASYDEEEAEIEQLRRDLSAMIYHDMRGPLQSIRGSIQKLAEVLANHENPLVLTMLQIGIRSTRQLRVMLDSLLDIQRLEAGQAILRNSPTELRVLLADAIQLVQPLAIDANQRLKFEWDNNLPMVDVDNDMILRVIINLMENAIKYTPEGGIITLGAYPLTDERICVTVKDSGPGIPRHMKDRIFDKFSRVRYRNAPQGLGLGLAFCRLAVDAHGGDIWVESEAGDGAMFCFTLPICLTESDDITLLATTA